jgi:hypothetical protein
MTSSGDDWSPFQDRFALELIGDDGVLIDLRTGNFFHVNKTATQMCLALRESTSHADSVARFAASMALASEDAAALLDHFRAQLSASPGVRTETTGPFRYCRHQQGYALEQNGSPILTTDLAGQKLRLRVPPDTLKFTMLDYVRAMTPKLLYLRGITVLHASACELPDGIVAFSGRSGAGKTTTARAFAIAGARLISEDLVVLAADSRVMVVPDGEKRARDWATTAADTLARHPDRELDCGELADVRHPGLHPSLTAIWFVDERRRDGETFSRRTLNVTDGVLALLGNNFLGSDGAESWRRHVRATSAIAAQVALTELTMPDGLDRLATAARAYATKTAS